MYVCALRPRGEPLSRADVFGYMARLRRRPDATLHSVVEGPFAAVAMECAGQLRPRIGRWRSLIAVGDVRLDDRSAVAGLGGLEADNAESDLQLVLAALDRAGEACVREILGDFAFVVWDARAQKLLAVRDAFGVKPLYHRSWRDLVLFSSQIAPLQLDEEYDLDYIADYLVGHRAPATHTIWRGVTAIGAGSLVRYRGTVPANERYWSADRFAPAPEGDEEASCSRFRELLEEGVRARMHGAGDVWAQLSGGLDSSSVVALASTADAAGSRLAGTVTVVDSMGEGDERAYSDEVLARFGVANQQVRDYWPWQDDGEPAPATDQPYPMLPFHARDRRMWDVVRQAGSRVLLSGMGSDHYLHGTLDYITDLASAGQVRAALREVTLWSVETRQSFWRLGQHYLVNPFLHGPPAAGRAAPAWLTAELTRRLGAFTVPAADRHPRRQGRFAGRIAAGLDALPAWLERWPYGEEVEMRYPFLYRPLVEWSLRLPARHRIRPGQRKWVLREAMRGLLPETVRLRSTKGGIDARILWSLQREKARLDQLLRDPILAQLGCIDPAVLRSAVDDARRGIPVHNVQLFSALSLETWLAARAGTQALPGRAATAA